MTRPLSIGDVRAVVGRIPDLGGIVLVGGQALNFWAEALGIADERSNDTYGPAVSADIDFLGPPAAALAFGQAAGGRVKMPGFDDAHSPNTGLVTLEIEGAEHFIDFLGSLKGFSARELDQLRRAAVPAGSMQEKSPPLLIMHPMHCLQSQLENVYGAALNRRGELGGERYVGRVRLAVEACRRITERYVAASDARSALKVAEKVHALSLLPAALRAWVEDEVRIDDGISRSPAMPAEFIDKRLPQLQRIRDRRLAAFRRASRASSR